MIEKAASDAAMSGLVFLVVFLPPAFESAGLGCGAWNVGGIYRHGCLGKGFSVWGHWFRVWGLGLTLWVEGLWFGI